MPKINNLYNKKFGRLTVVGKNPIRKGSYNKLAWECQCQCGKKIYVFANNLPNGHTKSCGCHKKDVTTKKNLKHGFAIRGKVKRVYKIWLNMINRCTNPKCNRFHIYGGRNISVCKRWRKFENFYKDMGDPPSNRHTIERLSNDGNYEPSNCKWATYTEQANNKRNNFLITYNGKTQTATMWGREIGVVSGGIISSRINRGWDIEKALITPNQKRRII